MENKPSISVLMPAYNAEKYIAVAIESILNQTFTNFEFIIIDDCSSDKTWGIIKEYSQKDFRIIPLKNDKNVKISKTLNIGIEAARAKYIARMDADDYSYPERLEKQFNYMENNPDIVISGGNIEICDENLFFLNVRKYNYNDQDIRKKIFMYSPFCHPAVIFKTNEIKKINMYNTKYNSAEDYDMYFRIGNLGKFGNIPEIILKLRTRESSISQKNSREQEKLTLKIRKLAIKEYGYSMGLKDNVYFILQFTSMFLIPQKYKFKIFNQVRKFM